MARPFFRLADIARSVSSLVGGMLAVGVFMSCSRATEQEGSTTRAPGLLDALFGETRAPEYITDCPQLAKWWSAHAADHIQQHISGKLQWEVRYMPAICSACREQRDARLQDPAIQKRVRELDGTSAYALRVSTTDAAQILPDEAYIQAHAWEQVGTDTVPCVFAHLEAAPGLVPYRSFLLAFDHPQDGADREVHIDDPERKFGGDLVLRFAPGTFQLLHQLTSDTLSAQ